MINLKSDDTLVEGHCPLHRLRVLFADATDTAWTLSQRHSCGPAASLVLAESLVAVGLLSADIQDPAETVSLRFEFDGPVGGVLVEASGVGHLRGYTTRKLLPDLDGQEELNVDELTGSSARVAMVRATSKGQIVSQAAFDCSSGRIRDGLQQCYVQSLQLPARASLYVASLDTRLEQAQGLMLQCMPDGDHPLFEELEQRFTDGTVAERLSVDCSLDSVRDLLGLPGLRVDRTRPLAFGCRCSRDRAMSALSAMSVQELNGIRRSGRAQHVACHMCGADYVYESEEIGSIISRKQPPEA